MLKWGYALAITDGSVCSGFDQNLNGSRMIRSSIAENDCFHQGRPSKVVDVIQWCAACDQTGDHVMMAKMCCGNQGGAIVNTGDQVRSVPKLHCQRHQIGIIGNGGNGKYVIGPVFQRVHVRTACCECPQGVIMRGEGRNMRGRSFRAISDIRIGPLSDKTIDVVDPPFMGSKVKTRIRSDIRRRRCSLSCSRAAPDDYSRCDESAKDDVHLSFGSTCPERRGT